MLRVLVLVLAVFAVSGQTLPDQSAVPATPSACLKAVTDRMAERQRQAAPMTADVARAIQADRLAMLRSCAAKFDAATVSPQELTSLADLQGQAGLSDLARATIARALAVKPAAEAQRADTLAQAVRTGLTEPKGEERNARLEKYVDELDTLSSAVFEQKFRAHQSMLGYYRGDDIDAGIIKHATWIIAASKNFTPAERQRLRHDRRVRARRHGGGLGGAGDERPGARAAQVWRRRVGRSAARARELLHAGDRALQPDRHAGRGNCRAALAERAGLAADARSQRPGLAGRVHGALVRSVPRELSRASTGCASASNHGACEP